MRAFPAPDPRDGEVLAARQVPREPWRNDHTWVRFSPHVCQKYRHRPADSTSLELFLGTLASNGQTAAQQAQAPCAVAYDAVFWSPEVQSLRHDDAVAPTTPNDGEDGLAARKPESVIGHSRMLEEHAHVLVQAHGTREQTNPAWREVEATLKDEIMLRHDSPKTLQAYAGWMRKFRGFPGHYPSGGGDGRGGRAVFGRSGRQETGFSCGATPGVQRPAVSVPICVHTGTR